MTEQTTYEQLLHVINGVQDFGVVGGMGDLVNNSDIAKALCEQGCIVVKPLTNIRKRRYTNDRKQRNSSGA